MPPVRRSDSTHRNQSVCPEKLHSCTCQYHAIDGISEVANVYGHKSDPLILQRLNLRSSRPIIVLRSTPGLASYNSGEPLEKEIIARIRQSVREVQVIQIERVGDNDDNHLPIFDARTLFDFADVVLSEGGTMSREVALLGSNAITYFAEPLSVDRYLMEKGMLDSYPGRDILKVNWKREVLKPRRRVTLDDFEHPFGSVSLAMKVTARKSPRSNKSGELPLQDPELRSKEKSTAGKAFAQ